MIRKTVLLSLLIIVVLIAGIPESVARSQYFDSLTIVYGDGSCGTCHVRPSGGGQLNSYGTQFENQPNYRNDPITALKSIGQPPGTSATSAVTTATLNSTPQQTPGISKEIPDEEETQEETQKDIESEEDIESQAEPTASVPAKVTPTASGFGIVVSLVGLFVCALLAKRHNK